MRPTAGRLIVDPSLLLSDDGLSWLEQDGSARAAIIIPATFAEWLAGTVEIDRSVLFSPEDIEFYAERRARLDSVLGGVPSFSHREVALRPRAVEAVRRTLFDVGDPVAILHADEWAFLQSHSVMLSKLRRPLRAFRDAGSAIVEFGRKTGTGLLEQVIPKQSLPETVTAKVVGTAVAKWVVVGGAAAGGGTLAGVAGTALGGPAGPWIGKLGLWAGGRLGQAAVLAIDP